MKHNWFGSFILAKAACIALASTLDADCQVARMGLISALTLGIITSLLKGTLCWLFPCPAEIMNPIIGLFYPLLLDCF